MSCPTCSATMQGIGYGAYHCPRCGTIKHADGAVVVPALVGRCREFEAWCEIGSGWKGTSTFAKWHGLGIAEAIRLPEDRK